jgi:hypothetical protein
MPTTTYPVPAVQRPQGGLTVDNVFRRMLKVANPRDPDEVAKALLARYSDDAQKIKREQAGVPITSYQLDQMAGQVSGPLSSEIRQATDDLERDLGALVSDIQLKDIAAELRGLSEAVRDAAAKGLDAAKLALDPAQRDRAFAARRTLGDYARLTRLLGALTACATALYCRVSQSIDMCSNIILVSAGEALAAAGVTKSGGLLQVPAAELQSRRDAIIGALRRMLGAEGDVRVALSNVLLQQSTGPAPGSASALALVVDELEQNGAQDLRALLDEGFVTSQLDNLLDHAIASTPDSLRSIGSTAVVTSGMLSRFADLARPLTTTAPLPERAIISDYVSSLDGFIAGFRSGETGYRLPFLARPPLLGYGFYGAGGVDAATSILQTLAVKRSQIAELIDCLCCECTDNSAVAAAICAKLLFDLDRAIDLFCLGDSDVGIGMVELHAAAYGYVLDAARNTIQDPNTRRWRVKRGNEKSTIEAALPRLNTPLVDIQNLLRQRSGTEVLLRRPAAGQADRSWGIQVTDKSNVALTRVQVRAALVRVLHAQLEDERRWRKLALSWSPICDQATILAQRVEDTAIGFILARAERPLIPLA